MNEIHIPWESKYVPWNEVSAKIIESFGLPGIRYSSHPRNDSMVFIFKNSQDALMCNLLVSEYI